MQENSATANSVKIREYRVMPRGQRGGCITLPPEWLRDNGISNGDTIEVFRTGGNDDVLILKRVSATA